MCNHGKEIKRQRRLERNNVKLRGAKIAYK